MKYTVLVADDEQIIRKGITKLILSYNLSLEIAPQAKTGLELLEIAETFRPNIIIADINMPLLNGLEAIERICRLYSDIAVVIVSGYDKFEYARKAIDLGVLAYLLKPFSNDQFREVLQKAINHCRDMDSTRAVLNNSRHNDLCQEDILRYINQNYCSPGLSLPFLEEKFFLGRTAIGNHIRKKTGKTLVDYINHLRVEHSKLLMRNEKDLSINTISDILGFNNQHYFSRVFKRYCGISPSEFRAAVSGSPKDEKQ